MRFPGRATVQAKGWETRPRLPVEGNILGEKRREIQGQGPGKTKNQRAHGARYDGVAEDNRNAHRKTKEETHRRQNKELKGKRKMGKKNKA